MLQKEEEEEKEKRTRIKREIIVDIKRIKSDVDRFSFSFFF